MALVSMVIELVKIQAQPTRCGDLDNLESDFRKILHKATYFIKTLAFTL